LLLLLEKLTQFNLITPIYVFGTEQKKEFKEKARRGIGCFCSCSEQTKLEPEGEGE
jgi:hypothetical protein